MPAPSFGRLRFEVQAVTNGYVIKLDYRDGVTSQFVTETFVEEQDSQAQLKLINALIRWATS